MNPELLQGITKHLIASGLTFNAENPANPIITRPMNVEILVATVMEYLLGEGYANTTKTS